MKVGGNQAFIFTEQHICVCRKALWTGNRASIGKQINKNNSNQAKRTVGF